MSWQDDLRQLDQALAQGQVSADEYRKRRDQLLATATSGGAPEPAQQAQPVQQPSGQPEQPAQQPPAQPEQQAGQAEQPQQQPSGPFAPPFRWDPAPESTQVVTPDNPERTQVVSQQPNQFGQQHSPESDRTQTIRPPGGQTHTPPPWQAQQPAPPPWGVDDGPVSMPNPTWLSHGPEVFEPTTAKKRSKLPLILIAVVVVIGLGVGAFFLFGNQGGNDPGPAPTGQSQAAPPSPTEKPKDDLEVAKLEGTAADTSDVKTFADAEARGFLTPDEQKLYKNGDPGKARMTSVTMSSGVKVYIFTTQLASAENATTAANALAAQQVTYGMKQYTEAPQGVLANNIEKSGSTPATIRAHYVHKSTVVRIQVYGDDMAQVSTVFGNVVKAQLEALAATT